MPIGDPQASPVLARHFENIYSQWIKPAVESLVTDGKPMQITCQRADKELRPGDIITQVIEALSDADIVIADLTGKNPNVFYELGVRHALRNNTVLIAQDIQDIPFDLRGLRTICYQYEPESLLALRSRLQETLSQMISTVNQIDNPVRRFLYDREVAKLAAAPVPPGYDALDQLVTEMHAIREDLAERVAEMHKLVEYSTAHPSAHPDTDAEGWVGAEGAEGAWTSTEHGGLYILRTVGSELRGPYCYLSEQHLDAHFFNMIFLEDRLICRFSWFDAPISGYAMFRRVNGDTLAGGWWSSGAVPIRPTADLRDMGRALPMMRDEMIPLTLVKVALPSPLPIWASEYFDRVARERL